MTGSRRLRFLRPAGAALVAGAALLATARPGSAQDRDQGRASTLIAPDHWLHPALRRLNGLGLVAEGLDVGARAYTERQADRILREAAGAAAGTPFEALARGYLNRFVEEFGGRWAAGGDERPAVEVAGAVGVGYGAESGRLAPGTGYRNEGSWTGPRELASTDAAIAGADLRIHASGYVAARVAATAFADSVRLDDAYALASLGKVGLWFGRRTIGFGSNVGGGLVLAGTSAFVGGGIEVTEGFTLPSVLRHLGPVRVRMVVSRTEANGLILEPWFWAGRFSIQPHPRLVIGINRAAMFGSDGRTPFKLRDLVYVMIGKHAGRGSETDNQIAALDVWYRLPIDGVPLSVYAEWGFEDNAGAWKDVPGVVAGAELAAVPGVSALSLGIERASFAPVCCGNPIWYRHWRFHAGWVDDGRPLGHPLGGHGREWRVYGGIEPWDARVRLRADGFLRDRGEENLFAPDWQGESRGGSLDALVRVTPRSELRLRGLFETGESGWEQSRLELSGRVFFQSTMN